MSSKLTPLSILQASLEDVISLQTELREELANLKNSPFTTTTNFPDFSDKITELESKIQTLNLQVEQLEMRFNDHLSDYHEKIAQLKEQILPNQESSNLLSKKITSLQSTVEKIECLLCQSPTRKSPNYLVIREYLQKNDWYHANQETYKIVLFLTNSKQWLDTGDLNKLSRYDLSIIDYLWSSYSNNRFGLSVQLKLWKLPGLPLTHDYALEKRLSSLLGWYTENLWTPPETSNYFEQLPIGHFPHLPLWIGFHSSQQSRIFPRLRTFFTKVFPRETQE